MITISGVLGLHYGGQEEQFWRFHIWFFPRGAAMPLAMVVGKRW